MKTLFLASIALSSSFAFSQGFVNGSFESTSSTGCDYNNSIAAFNAVMDNVVMFAGTETDIHESGCFIPSIPDGSKAVGIANTDALNIEFSTPLVSGQMYELTFWMFGNTSFGPLGSFEVGSTEDSGVMGDIVGSVSPGSADTWEEHVIVFEAPNNGTHLSVRNTAVGPWHQIDHFRIEAACTPMELLFTALSICEGAELTLDAEGIGEEMTWTGGIFDGVPFVPGEAGTYTYTATSDSPEDCPLDVEVEVLPKPSVFAGAGDEEFCEDESIVLSAGGDADEYTWDPLDLDPGVGVHTYMLVGTYDAGCSDTDYVDVTVHPFPTVTASVDSDPVCIGTEVVFTGGGAETYEWDVDGVEDGEPYETIAVGTTTYTVTGTDENGCVNTATVESEVVDQIEITGTTTDEILGADGSIDIDFTGGAPSYTVDWDNDETGDFDDPADIGGLTGGTYTVVVRGSLGCEGTATFTVNSQLALDKDNLINGLDIYPNPTVDMLTISFEGIFNYQVLNTNGAILFNGTATNVETISLAYLSAGVYFVKLNTADQTTTARVIKN